MDVPLVLAFFSIFHCLHSWSACTTLYDRFGPLIGRSHILFIFMCYSVAPWQIKSAVLWPQGKMIRFLHFRWDFVQSTSLFGSSGKFQWTRFFLKSFFHSRNKPASHSGKRICTLLCIVGLFTCNSADLVKEAAFIQSLRICFYSNFSLRKSSLV